MANSKRSPLFELCERRSMDRLPHQRRASRKTCFFVFCAARWAQNPSHEADCCTKFALCSCRVRTFAVGQTPSARLVRTMRAPFNVPSPAPTKSRLKDLLFCFCGVEQAHRHKGGVPVRRDLNGFPTARKYSRYSSARYARLDYRLICFGRITKNSYQLFFPRLPVSRTIKKP